MLALGWAAELVGTKQTVSEPHGAGLSLWTLRLIRAPWSAPPLFNFFSWDLTCLHRTRCVTRGGKSFHRHVESGFPDSTSGLKPESKCPITEYSAYCDGAIHPILSGCSYRKSLLPALSKTSRFSPRRRAYLHPFPGEASNSQLRTTLTSQDTFQVNLTKPTYKSS